MESPADGRRGGDRPSRRRILSTLAVVATGSVAGCTGLRERTVEAASVGLDETDRRSLALEETHREAPTTETSALGGTVSVRIGQHAAVYTRAAGFGAR